MIDLLPRLATLQRTIVLPRRHESLPLSAHKRPDGKITEKSVQPLRERYSAYRTATANSNHWNVKQRQSIGKTFPARASRSLETGNWDGTEILAEFLKDQITVTICGVMMRTALLRARGGFSLNFPHAADVAAWAPLLFLGNAGFVNEACATFSCHNKSETARMSVEEILRDGWQMANVISDQAKEHIGDAPRRRMLQVQSRRCFARRGLVLLSDYRKNGGDIQTLLNFIWRSRRYLSDVNVAAVLRLMAIVLCPRWLADRIRELRPTVPERLA
jgi:hypothetical protein